MMNALTQITPTILDRNPAVKDVVERLEALHLDDTVVKSSLVGAMALGLLADERIIRNAAVGALLGAALGAAYKNYTDSKAS